MENIVLVEKEHAPIDAEVEVKDNGF